MKFNILFKIIPIIAGGMSYGAVSSNAETGKFVDTTVHGIPDGEDDYKFTITFKGTRLGYHSLYVVLSNSLTKSVSSFQNDSTYPGSYVVREYNWTKQRILLGATKDMNVVIPRKMIADKGNTFYFYNEEYTDSSFSNKSSYMRSTRLDVVKPQTYTLPSNSNLTNGGYSGFSIYNNTFKNTAYQIEHRAFMSEFVDPPKNRLPFEFMLIRYRNYLSNYCLLPYRDISLRIYSYLENFSLWPTKTDGIRRWVEIPLSLYYSYDTFYCPGLKEPVGVSVDGRVMKAKEDMVAGDLLTRDVYLPPVMPNDTNVYSMEMIISNCGDNMVDTIKYKFEIYRSYNEVGSCATSRYCLEDY